MAERVTWQNGNTVVYFDGDEGRWEGPGPDPVAWAKMNAEREQVRREREAFEQWCELRRNGEHVAAASLAKAFGQTGDTDGK